MFYPPPVTGLGRWPVLIKEYLLLKEQNLAKGLDSFPIVGNVLQPHACAASCIASRNHIRNKLKIHIADRKRC